MSEISSILYLDKVIYFFSSINLKSDYGKETRRGRQKNGVFTTTAILLIVLSNIALAYPSFSLFNTSRFSRAISMGNAFIGFADGIETVYYNSSGIALLDRYGIAYSHGQGYQLPLNNTPYDLALIIPISAKIGTFAFTHHYLLLDDEDVGVKDDQSWIYQLHYGRRLFENLTVGASVNYYKRLYEIYEIDDHAFDVSISALYWLKNIFSNGWRDELRIGFQLKNAFATKMIGHELYPNTERRLLQTLGSGISYQFQPIKKTIQDLQLIHAVIASDFVFDNDWSAERYKYDILRISLGLELSFLELINLRFGRQYFENLRSDEFDTLQLPATRYGFGLNLPLTKLLSLKKDILVKFDYSISTWDQQSDFDRILQLYSRTKIPNKTSFSVQIQAAI